jgi:dipeptidyl aminopeptidase/acylaminoacyl peptidase
MRIRHASIFEITMFVAFGVFCACAGAQEALLVSREKIELPAFDEIYDKPLIHLYTSPDEYAQVLSGSSFSFERLTYLSGDLEVVALFYRPAHGDKPLPAIVFNRGSYVRHDTAPEYLTMFHRLAGYGYSILAPMYRGSEGGEGQDEMGGDDLNDLMQVATLARELPSVDAQRLFLLGESRGGMMVLQAIRDDFPARAAAIYGSPTDFHSLFDQYPEQYEPIADQIWPHWRENEVETLGRRSAVDWAESIDVPVLIMHGRGDQSMPVTQSLSLASRLQAVGGTYELHIFGYDNHAISGRAAERDRLATAWFRKHDID